MDCPIHEPITLNFENDYRILLMSVYIAISNIECDNIFNYIKNDLLFSTNIKTYLNDYLIDEHTFCRRSRKYLYNDEIIDLSRVVNNKLLITYSTPLLPIENVLPNKIIFLCHSKHINDPVNYNYKIKVNITFCKLSEILFLKKTNVLDTNVKCDIEIK